MSNTTLHLGHDVYMTCDDTQCEFTFNGVEYALEVQKPTSYESHHQIIESRFYKARMMLDHQNIHLAFHHNKNNRDGKYIGTAPCYVRELRERYPEKRIFVNTFLSNAYLEENVWFFTNEEPKNFTPGANIFIN